MPLPMLMPIPGSTIGGDGPKVTPGAAVIHWLPFLAFIGWPMTFIGRPMTFIGSQVTFIGWLMTFIGWPMALIGWPMTYVGWPMINEQNITVYIKIK